MKLIHMADLHFGKMLYDLNLVTEGDQGHMAEEILRLVREEKPDGILIAGDFFDRRTPPGEARNLAGDFLTALRDEGIPVFLVAGNHDSPENVDYLREILKKSGLYVSGRLSRHLFHTRLEDEWGGVNLYLLPYFFPALVQNLFPEAGEIRTYTEAARVLLEEQEINPQERNVIIAHQLVVDGENRPCPGGSESFVGGVGQIDAGVWDAFDYVALGHIHRPQKISREGIRYAGAPLCYHFDESGAGQSQAERGVTVVEIGKKGDVQTRQCPIHPLHPLCTLRGSLEEILSGGISTEPGAYVRVRLTDSPVPRGAMDSLSAKFSDSGSVLVCLEKAGEDRGFSTETEGEIRHQDLSLEELYLAYYREQRGGELPPEEIQELIRFAADALGNHPDLEAEDMARTILSYVNGRDAR